MASGDFFGGLLGGDLGGSGGLHAEGGALGEKLAATLRCTDGVAEAFAKESLQIVDALQMGGQRVGSAGSSVNHTPALRRAQVGIALRSASDAAREAAQVVMAKPGLAAIVAAVATARAIFARVRTYSMCVSRSFVALCVGVLVCTGRGASRCACTRAVC